MAHIHQQIDFTAEAIIVHDDCVLLRHHEKYKTWLTVGGHIELNEDPNEALLREVREEVGLTVQFFDAPIRLDTEGRDYHELVPPRFLNRHRISATHEHVSLEYIMLADSRNTREPDGHERSGGLRWFSREELSDPKYNVQKSIQCYARAALEAVQHRRRQSTSTNGV